MDVYYFINFSRMCNLFEIAKQRAATMNSRPVFFYFNGPAKCSYCEKYSWVVYFLIANLPEGFQSLRTHAVPKCENIPLKSSFPIFNIYKNFVLQIVVGSGESWRISLNFHFRASTFSHKFLDRPYSHPPMIKHSMNSVYFEK